MSWWHAGVPPKDSSILINALLIHHYKRGAYYPKGGASEIAFHIIRTIQKYGGNCLVRAPVSQILVNEDGAAYGENRLQSTISPVTGGGVVKVQVFVPVFVPGVKVRKGQEEVDIHAPVVVSNCGIFTTFQKLLPPEIQVKQGMQLTSFWTKTTLAGVDTNFDVILTNLHSI